MPMAEHILSTTMHGLLSGSGLYRKLHLKLSKFLILPFVRNRDGTIVGQVNTAQHERSMESAATEFQRRFHISVDDLESNRSSGSLSQVAIFFFTCMRRVKNHCMGGLFIN
jgi:hypothetical protein